MLNYPPFPSGERGAGGIGGIKKRFLTILFGDHGSLGTRRPQKATEKWTFTLGQQIITFYVLRFTFYNKPSLIHSSGGTMESRAERSVKINQWIIAHVEAHPHDLSAAVAAEFHISRQAAQRHIQKLADSGALISTGTSRRREYKRPVEISQQLPLAELQEDEIWRLYFKEPLQYLPPHILHLCQYGLTGILNNAVQHSEGNSVLLKLTAGNHLIRFMVIDDGLGIFDKIQTALELNDPQQSCLELAKGKLTTAPDHHNGEGLFFISRCFDSFDIVSHNLRFSHNEQSGYWLVEENPLFQTGTAVILELAVHSPTELAEVFSRYSTDPDRPRFDRTNIPVALAGYGDENLISRSQARRLVPRLERFRQVILDFAGVESLGPDFADEIFRVYHKEHPEVHLIPFNARPEILKMIFRALNTR